jgi:hypothetical protein
MSRYRGPERGFAASHLAQARRFAPRPLTSFFQSVNPQEDTSALGNEGVRMAPPERRGEENYGRTI